MGQPSSLKGYFHKLTTMPISSPLGFNPLFDYGKGDGLYFDLEVRSKR
jgi:hypothetical protein